MKGLVAVTNPGWYHQLSTTPGPKEANFWKPSAKALSRLPIGTPFFFKLKAPHHAIAGFGYLAGFSILPDWLAWGTFGEANGVESREALRSSIRSIQKGARIEPDPQGRIGCSLIAEARFFSESAWVEAPRDWSPRTQMGKSYDLEHGEGLRIWQECLARAGQDDHTIAASAERERYGTPVLHRPRLGQGIFRVHVLDAYGRACAVTGEHSLPVLEAAHIKPYSKGGEHDVSNGLSLRSDLHRLFDAGYITVDEQLRLVVGNRLKDDYDNGRSYYAMKGRKLVLPKVAGESPDVRALEWHRETAFLG